MTANFQSLQVIAFESRRAKEMEKLITRFGGKAFLAPALKEVPMEENQILSFGKMLMTGKCQILVLMTGVGTELLLQTLSKHFSEEKLLKALGEVIKIVRGPKPKAVLRKIGIAPDLEAKEPHTFREVLDLLEELPLQGKSIFVQEYGASNASFLQRLKEKGADVTPLIVYRWALPDDTKPLLKSIQMIAQKKADVVLFTSAPQVRHLMAFAEEKGCAKPLYEGFKQTLIGSIGPSTTEALLSSGLKPDYEPDQPKMVHFIREAARVSQRLLRRKRLTLASGKDTSCLKRVEMVWGSPPPRRSELVKDSPFLKACRREPTPYTPIWLMRQAGRFLREYRTIRQQTSFPELLKNAELSAEITLMAVDRLGVDAAILFSDLLLLLEQAGFELHYANNHGPRIANPICSQEDLQKLPEVELDALSFVFEAIELTTKALDPSIPLIGFAGGPFTLACYAVEGGGSKSFPKTKKLMFSNSSSWHELMEKLTSWTASYLRAQITHGCDAVQIFDTWIGCLSPEDYKTFALPYSKKLVESIQSVPVIYFGLGTATLLELMKETGADVIGLDWKVDLKSAWQRLGSDVAVQGNLDPAALYAPPSEIKRRVKCILDQAGRRPGHIFNLGHGVLPDTPAAHVLELVDFVHELSEKKEAF